MKYFLSLLLFLGLVFSAHAETVVIDSGHTMKEPGAISALGITEWQFNTRMADVLSSVLRERGYTVIRIENLPLSNRPIVFNKSGGDILIMIHHDSVQPKYLTKQWTYNGKVYKYTDDIRGYSVFVNGKSPKSIELGLYIGASLWSNSFVPSTHHKENIKGERRKPINEIAGLYEFNDLYVLKRIDKPGVLIECGVIVNRYEAIFMSDYKVMVKFARAVADGIGDYFGK